MVFVHFYVNFSPLTLSRLTETLEKCKTFSVRLSAELYDRFINFLNEHAKGDTQSDKFRDFIKSSIQPTKEEFLKSIQSSSSEKPDLEAIHNEQCVYYAKLENGKIECGRLLSKKGKTIILSDESCKACWKRRVYVRRKASKTELNAIPLACLRRLRIYPTNRQIACEQVCKLHHIAEYRACRELRSERKEV